MEAHTRTDEADERSDAVVIVNLQRRLERSTINCNSDDRHAAALLNGERVDRAVLTNGSEARVGKFRLNFFVSPADLEPAADQ